MDSRRNRQVVLVYRPVGVPEPRHFEVVSSPLPALGDGQFLVENLYLSVDPAQRGYVNDENNYAPPVPIGAVMRAMAVGRVVESRHIDFQVGEHLYGWFGWQDYWVGGPEALLRRVDPAQATLSAGAGLLGINGLTAWLALHEIGRPKANNTVVVTAAAGAVGSIVGQLAKLAGCRTVAVVGSDEKGELCLSQYGYDTYVNYRHPLDEALAQACPGGIDLFFDNVAGSIADTVIRRMNLFGRVVQCGTMSIPVWIPPPQGPRIEREILTRRLRIEGFVIFDHIARFDEAAAELAQLFKQGQLHYAEDIDTDLALAPQALVDVYEGRNRGKKLIRLRD
ncbi:NADP-dependent oxidoreductase [Pseudomonas umsongensis]|uniref:NADP-dependent oxidoreductase n=1 Tax=Pseudomonas umsongensis TaxID=198618 RepID=UPI00200B93FB|nr:NADP-dependent oxidoreductase [Pseudomonas umsongensis]MCK8683312.1 NADP-dependent oxidoreductase [Pseudomonas umsongensis]